MVSVVALTQVDVVMRRSLSSVVHPVGWPEITSKYIVIKRLWNEAIYLYTLCLYYSKQSSGITEEKEMADKGNTKNLEV